MKTKRQTKTTPETSAQAPGAGFLGEKLRSPAFLSVMLAVATLFAYFAVGHYGFVDYDDGDYVSANPHVEGGLKWESVKWAFTTGHASNWHPLTWLSHMLDYQLFGRNTGAQHLVNLGLHVLNTLLLFLVLRRMTGAHWRSAMVAALFALHPLHVESVAWLSERKDVLSTAFLLLTVGAYALYAQEQPGRNKEEQRPKSDPSSVATLRRVEGRNPKAEVSEHKTGEGGRSFATYYVLSLVFFALGLMSKPMLVTVPFLLLLLDYWPLGRLDLGATDGKLRVVLRLIIEKLPFFLLAIGSSVITFIVQRKGGAVSTALTLGQRIGNAVVSYVRYLVKMFWPEDLAVLYPHPGSWPVWEVTGAALVLLVIFALVLWLARSRPYVPVGWLWFFGGLVPVIGIVQVGIQSMADRYSYVPLIGIFIMLTWGAWDLALRFQWRKEALGTVAVLLLGVCGLMTMRQVQFWQDSEALFRRAVEVEPKNYLAYNNLGFFLANHGKPAEALEYYRKSIEISPTYVDALNNMGHALAAQRRHAEAIPYYEAGLRSAPNHVEVHNNLGNALSELGRLDEAIAHYEIALKNNPEHADAHNNLGIALAMKGKLEEAVPHFREAIRLKPDYASAHSNLGNAFAVQQKWDEAISEYQQCLRLNPNDPQAHNNLANVLTQQGKLDEAVAHYTRALSLNTNNPEAHFNLGIALLRQNKRDEARRHFIEALRLKPDYVEAQRQIAALGAAASTH